MSLNIKIMGLVVMVTGIMVISALAYHLASLREEKLYNYAYLQNTTNSINSIMQGRIRFMTQNMEDNSAWDDMVQFVKNPDTVWARENLGSTRQTLKLDLIEVYSGNAQRVWSTFQQEHLPYVDLKLNQDEIRRIFLDGPTCHFYRESPCGLIEIWGSIIVPSLDIQRKTPGQGYLLFGKIWDKEVLQELESSTNSYINLRIKAEKTDSAAGTSALSTQTIPWPLNNFKGQEIARLSFLSKSIYKADTRLFVYFTLIPFTLALIVLIVFYILIQKWISQPLRKIVFSLDNQDRSQLLQIPQQNKEFREVARLLGDSFDIRRNLEKEVTERRKAEEQLTKLTEELAENIRSKDKFFSILAHDLKSPFHYLLGYSDLLRNEYPTLSDEERKRFISIIHSNSQRLYNLLENLLAWSRLQTGRMEFEMESFDLSCEVRHAVETVKVSAINKNIILDCKAADPAMIKADRNMIRSVIHNLLSNAIKYTPEKGQVSVRTKTYEKYIELVVSDSGIGMTPEEISKLFRIDVSISRPGTNQEPGTGLGLILTKEFVEKNGGTVFVESEVDKGSSFRIVFPSYKA
jgi:signal transduction histidine kinase